MILPQDLRDAMNVEELTQSLQLHSIRNHDWHIQVRRGRAGYHVERAKWVGLTGLSKAYGRAFGFVLCWRAARSRLAALSVVRRSVRGSLLGCCVLTVKDLSLNPLSGVAHRTDPAFT